MTKKGRLRIPRESLRPLRTFVGVQKSFEGIHFSLVTSFLTETLFRSSGLLFWVTTSLSVIPIFVHERSYREDRRGVQTKDKDYQDKGKIGRTGVRRYLV